MTTTYFSNLYDGGALNIIIINLWGVLGGLQSDPLLDPTLPISNMMIPKANPVVSNKGGGPYPSPLLPVTFIW